MRDGGQDYEVMIGKMPCATPAHACAGLLSVRRLLALSSFFLPASCCWCRGLFVWRPRRSKFAGHARMKRTVITGDAAQYNVQVETQR